MRKFSEYEIAFLKENFVKLGKRECAKKLNRTASSVKTKSLRMNVKSSPEEVKIAQQKPKKRPGEYNVKESLFITDINHITAYLLGLLWADGYLHIPKTEKHLTIRLQLIEPDALSILPIINYTGKWSKNISLSTNKTGTKTKHLVFSCSNPILCKFLKDNDYNHKSFKSPHKILSKIPKRLHKYFILGYLDGDGCIYLSQKSCGVQFTSTHKQDWDFLEKVSQELNVKYYIHRRVRKNRNSQYSSFCIHGFKNSYIFGKFLYNKTKHIFLKRKFNKYQIIKRKAPTKRGFFKNNLQVHKTAKRI